MGAQDVRFVDRAEQGLDGKSDWPPSRCRDAFARACDLRPPVVGITQLVNELFCSSALSSAALALASPMN